MAYTHTTADGRTYYLHAETVVRPGGRRWTVWTVYTFARRPRPGVTLEALPPGWRVTESPVTRRPSLRKA